jgi:hypothetical protein
MAKKFLQKSHEKHLDTLLQYASSKHPVHSAISILSQMCEVSKELGIHVSKQGKVVEALVGYIRDGEKVMESKGGETLYAAMKLTYYIVNAQEDLPAE